MKRPESLETIHLQWGSHLIHIKMHRRNIIHIHYMIILYANYMTNYIKLTFN